jgi:hypothetical protein
MMHVTVIGKQVDDHWNAVRSVRVSEDPRLRDRVGVFRDENSRNDLRSRRWTEKHE